MDIEAEWVEFKSHLRPHKYKITALLAVIMYPFYSSYLGQAFDTGKHRLSKYIERETQPTEPAFAWTENL